MVSTAFILINLYINRPSPYGFEFFQQAVVKCANSPCLTALVTAFSLREKKARSKRWIRTILEYGGGFLVGGIATHDITAFFVFFPVWLAWLVGLFLGFLLVRVIEILFLCSCSRRHLVAEAVEDNYVEMGNRSNDGPIRKKSELTLVKEAAIECFDDMKKGWATYREKVTQDKFVHADLWNLQHNPVALICFQVLVTIFIQAGIHLSALLYQGYSWPDCITFEWRLRNSACYFAYDYQSAVALNTRLTSYLSFI